MPLLLFFLLAFLDTLSAHIVLAIYLFAMMSGQTIWKYLKKLPFLLLSPLTSVIINTVLFVVMPEAAVVRYCLSSLPVLLMCTIWVKWSWGMDFWQAFSSVCMAGILQVATSALSISLRQMVLSGQKMPFAVQIGIGFTIALLTALLLKKLRFAACFHLLLTEAVGSLRTALLIFGLELSMEAFLILQKGVTDSYLSAYNLLVVVLVILMVVLVVHLAQRFDTAHKLQVQQDALAQQQLYEQDLEAIRQEVRTFRHDYKNLLAGLSQQAGAGELEQLRASLSELDAGFDQRLGEKIQASTQIGNLQIPQVRSLLLSKLTAMRERGVECRLEVLYPVSVVGMDIWDFLRCLGILLDNAIEAVQETDSPWVEIILLAQEDQVSLRVSNPWNGKVDPARFWEEGWSTKGKGRGLGLSSYLRILERYTNVSPCTSWVDGVFVQELTIGGTS